MTDDPKNLHETDAFDDDLEDDDLEDEGEAEERDRGAGVPPARGPRRPAPGGMGGPRRAGPAPTARTTRARAFVVDPSLRIRDRVSEAFVIATLVVFGLILVNALAFGRGGAFSATPTPVPTQNVTPAPSGSVSPSGSPEASPSVIPSVIPSAESSPAASPAPSAS